MNMTIKTNNLININERKNLTFIIKECDFSLIKVMRKIYSNFFNEIENFKNNDNIIEIPISFIFKETFCSENLNKPINTNNIIIKTQSTIENLCNCLEPIAKMNCNRFIYKNLNITLLCNKELFSRLILNLCYQLLSNCKKYSAIEIISYLEPEQYIIEITTEFILTNESKKELESIQPILKQLKSDFSYEILPTKEITFKITMPCENIHF